jgi:hypothetical protein
MTANDEKPPKPAAKSDRLAREAAALRANLLKRKDQARQRERAQDKSDDQPDRLAASPDKPGPGRADL